MLTRRRPARQSAPLPNRWTPPAESDTMTARVPTLRGAVWEVLRFRPALVTVRLLQTACGLLVVASLAALSQPTPVIVAHDGAAPVASVRPAVPRSGRLEPLGNPDDRRRPARARRTGSTRCGADLRGTPRHRADRPRGPPSRAHRPPPRRARRRRPRSRPCPPPPRRPPTEAPATETPADGTPAAGPRGRVPSDPAGPARRRTRRRPSHRQRPSPHRRRNHRRPMRRRRPTRAATSSSPSARNSTIVRRRNGRPGRVRRARDVDLYRAGVRPSRTVTSSRCASTSRPVRACRALGGEPRGRGARFLAQ